MTPHEEMTLNEGPTRGTTHCSEIPPGSTRGGRSSRPKISSRADSFLCGGLVLHSEAPEQRKTQAQPCEGLQGPPSVSEAPLSAINSLEFTLALYIITRLFTAIQGLMQTMCRAACLPSPASRVF